MATEHPKVLRTREQAHDALRDLILNVCHRRRKLYDAISINRAKDSPKIQKAKGQLLIQTLLRWASSPLFWCERRGFGGCL